MFQQKLYHGQVPFRGRVVKSGIAVERLEIWLCIVLEKQFGD